MTTVTIGDVTFRNDSVTDADGVLWNFSGLTGWGGEAEVRGELTPRTLEHGDFARPAYRGGLAPVLEGTVVCPSRASAAVVKRTLASLLADGEYGDMTVDDPDEGVLSASVRLGARPTVNWATPTSVYFLLPLYSAFPYRYGPPVSASASFPARVGGKVWPKYPGGVQGWGAQPPASVAVVSNGGTAPAPVQIEVTGPIDAAGFEVLDASTGLGLVFEGAVADGSRLLLDGATGNVLLDGLYDRGDVLTSRWWPTVPARGSVSLTFRRRGSDVGGAPSMTATVRPAYW